MSFFLSNAFGGSLDAETLAVPEPGLELYKFETASHAYDFGTVRYQREAIALVKQISYTPQAVWSDDETLTGAKVTGFGTQKQDPHQSRRRASNEATRHRRLSCAHA